MKKICCFAIALIFCAAAFTPFAAADTAPPELSASAYALANAADGEIMESKNAESKMSPASLTKMLTAVVVADRTEDLDGQRVTVSNNAVDQLNGTGSSTGGLIAGETYTPRELLNLLLVCSANDAANVLAEFIAGGNTAFAKLMNEKAVEIGMTGSNFVNPHGLDDDNHYTTAKDLALLACELMKYPDLREIWARDSFELPETEKQEARVIKTTNPMISEDSEYYSADVTGGKTGSTDSAGRCLTVSARRGDTGFVLVLLKCPPKYENGKSVRTEFTGAKAMLDYAFSAYRYTCLGKAGDVVSIKSAGNTFRKNVTAALEKDVWAMLKSGADAEDVKISTEWSKKYKKITAPVQKDAVLGKALFVLNGETVGETGIVAAEEVRANRLIVFWKTIDVFVYTILVIIGILLLAFAALVIRATIIRARRRARRRRNRRRYSRYS